MHAGIDVNAQLLGHQIRFSRAVGAPDLSDLLHRVATQLRELVPKSFLEGDATTAVSQVFASLFDAVDLGPIVEELDAIGARVRTKLQGFLTQIMNALLKLWTRLFDATLAVTPRGMVPRMQQGMKRVRAEFAVLDPAPIEQEVREIVDAVVDGLERFSPASLAAQLNGLFDPLKQKLQQLDPAALLGDLSPIDAVIEEFEGLRPSTVLAPLISSTADLKAALDRMLTIDFGAALESVIAKLRAQLEAVVADVQKEFEALLSFLESAAGGSVSVTVSV